jgi:tryptophan 2,3-dioxygenase
LREHGRAAEAPVTSPARDLTYASYLRLDDLLSCQRPLTDSHDELLFVIIHQVYELWFKQILHETELLQRRMEAGNSAGALHTARRIAKILKTAVGQMDVLETMTPQQFASFRPELGSSSGFQSVQFRYLEAVLGRRDFSASVIDKTLHEIMGRRPVFASLLRYLSLRGWQLPAAVLGRDPREPWQEDGAVNAVLAEVYADSATPAEVCEALVDIDEGVQEWRYRHVKMVERIIGAKSGTGGSSGAAYLRGTLFRPAFPDLWAIRSSPLPAAEQPGQRLDDCPPVRRGRVDERVVVAGGLMQPRVAAGRRGGGDVALAVAERHLVVGTRMHAQHGGPHRQGGHRIGVPVLRGQVVRTAAHQVARRGTADRVAGAVGERQHACLRDHGGHRDPRRPRPGHALRRARPAGGPGGEVTARAVPDDRDAGGVDGQVREQVDARRHVGERGRPAATAAGAGARAPVLQVPRGVAAPGQVGGERAAERQVVAGTPEAAVHDHNGPRRIRLARLARGQPQLAVLRGRGPVAMNNRLNQNKIPYPERRPHAPSPQG